MKRTTEALARLIEEFRALPADSDRRREIVAELDDDCGDADVAAFLVSVVADPREYDLARTEAATLLRLWPPADPAGRHAAGRALLAALDDPEEDLVRQYAAQALGPYADDPAVHEALAAIVHADDDPLVRDSALGAIKDAGPSDARTDVLRKLTQDADLGRAACRILAAWGRSPDA
ncbi:HEAT repeat domain-containing protein [Streptomyces sp. NPDC058240]|uniref:HEAT repeat domain-containing protein n=1 Tax=Streptomyces sp. NPDC058240 TaxID=3346396 RepID=UPI0036EACABA